MTYKEMYTAGYTKYSKLHDNVVYIGYNTAKGSRMYGTLNNIPAEQCIEAPVAENLMVGMAVGMALEGYRPVVCFERHDFLLLGLDALVNHVDKLPWLSNEQFKLPIIIRAIVGASKPLDPGPQHTQDYTTALQRMLKYTAVRIPDSPTVLNKAFEAVGNSQSGAVVIVEYKDTYDVDIEEDIFS